MSFELFVTINTSVYLFSLLKAVSFATRLTFDLQQATDSNIKNSIRLYSHCWCFILSRTSCSHKEVKQNCETSFTIVRTNNSEVCTKNNQMPVLS